jgi:hypothetical protein
MLKQNFDIGSEIRGDIPVNIPYMRPIYLKGIITKDLGDKFELDVTNNSDWTLHMINNGYAQNNQNVLGKFEKYSLEKHAIVRLPQTLMICPKEFLRPCRILVYEQQWFAPTYKPKSEKKFLKENGHYGCGKIMGYTFQSDGQFGFLQDTFDELMEGKKKEDEFFNRRKLIYKSTMYFTKETVQHYNKAQEPKAGL